MRKLHLTNEAGRNATVRTIGLKPTPPPSKGLPDTTIRFAKFLASTPEGLNTALEEKYSDGLADALIAGDPDVDIEKVGQTVSNTDRVFLSGDGEILYAAPEVVEVIFGPDGQERERRSPVEVPANVNETAPVTWTGKRIPKKKAVLRFSFRRTIQIQHVDGLTYDYLYGMAKDLSAKEEMVIIGGGPGGKKPLVFQTNGTPYRGLLEGRVDGAKYKLLLHLSNMELKRPAEAK